MPLPMLQSDYGAASERKHLPWSRGGLSTRRLIAFGLALLLLASPVSNAAPVQADGADGERERREEVRQERAETAAELDELQASDAELEAAVAELNAHVATQQARVDDAQRATQEARDEAARLSEEADETEDEIDELVETVRSRAVQSYIGNGGERGGADDALLNAENPADLEHRRVLIETAHGSDQNSLDQLAAARVLLERQREMIQEALEEAEQLEAETEERLVELEAARDEQSRLQDALSRRIGEFRAEVDALAAEEDRITAVIDEAEAEAERQAEEARRRAREAEEAARRAAQASSNGSTPQIYAGGCEAPASGDGLVWPTEGPLTSPFGQRWGRLHAGIDIGAPTGTPICAVDSGQVVEASYSDGGYGNLVVISHGDGFHTAYAHQSQIATSVGASVERGELIGYVGNTGNSTGPHLHFETRFNGTPRDPLNYLP